MSKHPAIQSIAPRNILSFGSDTVPIELGPLNVLIGPNGSGKSNLLEIISLLKAIPSERLRSFEFGGGFREWLWKGSRSPSDIHASIRTLHVDEENSVEYLVDLSEIDLGLTISNEEVRWDDSSFERNAPLGGGFDPGIQSPATILNFFTSILSQFNGKDSPPEISKVSNHLRSVRLYRRWEVGSRSSLRLPQSIDGRPDYLEEDLSNYGVVLSQLRRHRQFKRQFLDYLQLFLPGAEDYDVSLVGGSAQVFIQEKPFLRSTPASRLSDGTIRWMTLLVILLDPDPSSLLCIEEPDLGLHPDIMPTLAELLRDAATRTQLIVTTHSRELVDALSDTPEAIVVCEKHEGATQMKRLDAEQLAGWLKDYSLGELWSRGHVGGNRW